MHAKAQHLGDSSQMEVFWSFPTKTSWHNPELIENPQSQLLLLGLARRSQPE
jgi:hypothetical protein